MFEKKNYQVSHSFFAFPSGYISYRLKAEIPYIISLRGSDVPGFNERFLMQYFFLAPIFKRIWRGAEAVIANSHDLKSLALKTCPDLHMDIIYNGIDTDEFSPYERVSDGSFNILCVSRLIARKGVDYLIKALPDILKCHANTKLIIVGEGNMEFELKELTSSLGIVDSVIFRGYVPHEELPCIYKESDIFVLPSLWEGMSNSLLEAIASGLPVMVTDTGGTKELIRDNGIIIPKGDSSAISESVIRLLNNKELRSSMGLKSREIAMKFSWKNVAEQYIKYYERCVSKGNL
jgi:glycosyltransferase involved in cell wall biosynthesis